MPKAMELIVDGYVRANKRDALENLRLHRQRLAMEIRMRSSVFHFGGILEQIEEDIAFIEIGLGRLREGQASDVPGAPVESIGLERKMEG